MRPLADDNVDAATSLGMLLEMAGNNVMVVHDGTDAVIAAQQYRPQVAILDIGMPRMNGYQVAEKLRSEVLGPDALLIALTGWGQADDKARAMAESQQTASPERRPSTNTNVGQLVELTWRQQCTACHGETGKGDGQMGPMLQVRSLEPARLR